MRSPFSALLVGAVLLVAPRIAAQQPMEPSSERQQLAILAGNWNYEFTGLVPGSGTMNVARRQLRTTMSEPGRRSLVWERSIEGGPWEVSGEGTSIRSP